MTDDSGRPAPENQPQPRPRTFTFRRTFTFGSPPPTDDPNVTVISRPVKKFGWTWGGPHATPTTQINERPPDALEGKPQTYYEAFTGRRDPQREFFVNARRVINLGVTITALAFPVGLITLAIVTGQSLETIVFAGVLGAFIGLMLKSTFPKTMFD